MGGTNSPIFERIGMKVVEILENDAQFSKEMISKIHLLFESGEIVNQEEVLNALQGDLREDQQSRD